MTFRLFQRSPGVSRTTIRTPGLLYLTSEMDKLANRYIDYYTNIERYVNNTNKFARLLDFIRIDLTHTVDEIEPMIRDRTPVFGSMFDVTTYQRKGNAIYPGSFYGQNATEVWLGHDEKFDLSITDWRELTAVKVIRHGYSVISFPYLDGTLRGPENEMVVLSINLPMLAYQFYLWDLETVKNTGKLLSPEVFMTKVVIPRLIRSHLEITVFNRIMNNVKGLPNDSGKWFNNPFYIQDLSSRISQFDQEMAERLTAQAMTWEEVLGSLPTVLHTGRIHDIISIPSTLINPYNRWGFLVAYLPVLNFLITLDNLLKSNRNQGHRGRLWQLIRFMRNDGTVVTAFNRVNPIMTGFIDAEMEEVKLNIESR